MHKASYTALHHALLLVFLAVGTAEAFVRSHFGSWTCRDDGQRKTTGLSEQHGEPQPETSSLLTITESDWQGAGLPRDDLQPGCLPTLMMEALTLNDFPEIDSGLRSMWAFAGETTRHIFQPNETEYIESAHETANSFPTSFYGNALYGKSWKMLTPLNRVGGDQGWIATQVMETISSDGRLRRWQWELGKNRRPPNLNCWFVESIGSSDRKGEFEPE